MLVRIPPSIDYHLVNRCINLVNRKGRIAELLWLSIDTVRKSVWMWHLRQLHDLPSVLQVRICNSSDFWLSNLINVGYSDVHNIHPIHPFLERRVKPLPRTHSHPYGLNGAGTYDNGELCEQQHVISYQLTPNFLFGFWQPSRTPTSDASSG